MICFAAEIPLFPVPSTRTFLLSITFASSLKNFPHKNTVMNGRTVICPVSFACLSFFDCSLVTADLLQEISASKR
jgi:hypothetical protein